MLDRIGIVVIGRNEGSRLKTCIGSLPSELPTVYVDSGSTDGSPQWAREQGCLVVDLATDLPFSAARARNEGFERLMQESPDTEFVQFIDGDCELLEGWLETAVERLRGDERLAVVAGLRLERYPDRSWYNHLCAIEWDTPVGEADAVGGDAMYRISAFKQVDGFDPLMMAGEEPELCYRLRQEGYRVERLDADMTLHDANIMTYGAWWKRAVRSGYAYALGALKHGRQGYNVKPVVRSLFWGGALPFAFVIGALVFAPIAILVAALFAVKFFRIVSRSDQEADHRFRYAWAMMLTNQAEVFGIVRAFMEHLRGSQRATIEYK